MEQTVAVGRFLRRVAFFASMPEAALQAFQEVARVRQYSRRSCVLMQGEDANRLLVVVQGCVRLFHVTVTGAETVAALLTSGDVFGESAILDGGGYPFSADASEETELIEIPAEMLRRQAKSFPDVMAGVMASMAREIRKLQMENERLSRMTAPQRVASLLLQISSGMAGNGGSFSFPYDKSLAAARLGMQPETFSRSFAQLRPVGVTIDGPYITVDSFSALANYVA